MHAFRSTVAVTCLSLRLVAETDNASAHFVTSSAIPTPALMTAS